MAITPQEFRDKAAKRRKIKDADIPDIGTIRLRALSAGDAQQFQSDVKKAKADGKNEEELAFSLIARSWIGDDGELLFPEEEGIAFARTLDPETYNAIAKEVLALNGLSETAIEDAEKNSGAGRNGSTPSDSRETSVLQTSI
jgi:hypothetical protein